MTNPNYFEDRAASRRSLAALVSTSIRMTEAGPSGCATTDELAWDRAMEEHLAAEQELYRLTERGAFVPLSP